MAPLGTSPIPWLKPLSWLYGFGAACKNTGYDRGLRAVRRLPVPVVSIGNLCAGGTGKTPMVVWLVERYRDAGLRVGVLARGYGRQRGQRLNDEGRLLEMRYPGLPQAQQPDRHAAGLELLAKEQVDLCLLDDGFQHRRLHRDLDLCLLDGRDPFRGGLLPSGWLRESPAGLRRADLIVATGAHGLSDAEREDWGHRLPDQARDKPCFFATTKARDILALPNGESRPVETLQGQKVFLLAGIARPQRFEATVQGLGAEVVGRLWLSDHGVFSLQQLESWSQEAAAKGAILVITEKDEARMALDVGEGPERQVLRIDLELERDIPMELLLPRAMGAR